MATRPVERKLRRLAQGAPPRVLDLFAGCGGLSLGFQAAGCAIVGAVEIDPFAARSHALNFQKRDSKSLLELHARPRDVRYLSPASFLKDLGLGRSTENVIDIIVGGPPCQSFARIGRAKLREVAAHPHAYRRDPRANLYLRYLEFVKELKPLAILIENVPDVLNYGGHNIAEEICEALEDLGYDCRYTLLNAAYYGVPQMRERMFLLGYAKQLAAIPEFPAPTHWVELPRGYKGSRQFALKSLGPNLFSMNDRGYYAPPPAVSHQLPRSITAHEAMADLPRITLHLVGRLKRGPRRFCERVAYPAGAKLSRYARLMREWPGFENREGIVDHVIRYLPRDYPIFRMMQPGDQYPEAYGHAISILNTKAAQLAEERGISAIDRATYGRLKREIVPPYDPNKFPNKWRKMEADAPARTLMAHLGKDSYSHIHYDSSQARTISVREGARLQSFPDGFIFAGTMNPAFRQIGESVPPLLANALAHAILSALRTSRTREPLADRLLNSDSLSRDAVLSRT